MGKWFGNTTWKQRTNVRKIHRALGILLAMALVFQMVPFASTAVSASENSGGGLCTHHRSHTPDCGYKEAEPGHGCTHEHTEDCYRIVEDCIHEHAESCYPADNASESEATPADAEEKQPTECSHSCSGDSGCITKEPDCQHEHDDSCGYRVGTPGTPCTFICEICNGGISEDDGKENNSEAETPGTETGDETKEPDGEPAGKPDNGQEKCICEEPCEESSGNEGGRVNKECPVCGAENADLSDCKGKAEKEDTKQPEDTGICKHHQEHDDACGYQPESEDSEGSPCTYECRICPIEDLIAALPDKVTEDNAEDVRAQLDKILALFGELTEDEQEQIDLSRCYELQGALDGANDPAPITESVEYQEASWDGSQVTYESKTETCTLVENSAEAVTWTAGWYAVRGTVTIDQPITVTGAVNLILTDGCNLTAEKGIVVTTGNSLTIYAQSENGGTLTATGTTGNNKNASAGIGGSTSSVDSGSITIHGGIINATGGVANNNFGNPNYDGAGIGGSTTSSGNGGNSGTIEIYGGTITANSGEASSTGAGIGGGGGGNSKNGGDGSGITIYGGNVTAASHGTQSGGAGIGGGEGDIGDGGAGNNIQINGGMVHATGGYLGAGIGGGGGAGKKSGDGTVTISGGTVTAVGGSNAAGIGGGGGYQYSNQWASDSTTGGTGSVTISGGIVDAKGGAGNSSGNYAGAPIGNGGNSGDTAATVSKTNTIVFENGVGTVCGAVTLDGSYNVPADYTLNIPAGTSLSGSGTLSGGGTFTADLSEDMVSVPTDLYYNEHDRSNDIKTRLSAGLAKGIAICSQTFTVSGWTVEVEKTGDLTYTATYTNDSDNTKTFQKTITLQQSGTTLDGTVKTYNGETETKDFTASDTITVKATPTATGQAPANSAMFATSLAAPTAGQMAVFVGDTQVSEAVDTGADGSYTMTVSAADVLTNGQAGQDNRYTLIVRFVENTNMVGAEAQAKVTITPNPLTADMVTLSAESATYNGEDQKPTVTVDGLTVGIDYDIAFSVQDFTNAGTIRITVTGKGIYKGIVEKVFTINKATLIVRGNGIFSGTYGMKLSELTVGGSLTVNSPSGAGIPGRWALSGDAIPNVGDSGEYTATFTPVSGADNYNPATAKVKLNIRKPPLTVTGVTIRTRPYKPAYHTAEVSGVTFAGLVNSETLTLDEDYIAYGNYDDPNAGENKSATILVELKSSAKANNYTLPKDSSVNATGTITAIPIADKNVTLSPASAVYDGTEQKPTVTIAGLTEGTDYTVSYIGDFTKAGEHTVTVTGKGNYEGTVTKTFIIEKAEQKDFAATAVTTQYEKNGTFILSTTGGSGDGAVLYRVPENNGVLMVNGDQATIIGVGTVAVTATKAESDNYKAATATGKITIEKAPAPAITYPTAGSIAYGQKLSDSALTGGSTEYGTFAWENGSMVPAVDNTGYTVVFTASGETKKNYETITDTTQKVSVKVEKTVPAVSITAAVSGSKDDRQSAITVNVAKAGAGAFPTGTVTFIDCTGSTEVEIGAATLSNGTASYTWDGLLDKTYTIKAVYAGDSNYKEAVSREFTFDAAKQNQQDFALDAIGAKIYGDAAVTLKTTGGNGSGAVRYESSDEDVIRIEDGRAVIVGAGTATITAIK